MERLENIFDNINTLHRNKCTSELFTRLLKAKELVKGLSAELERHRWIPVSERLPKERKESYAVINNGKWQEEQWDLHGEGEDWEHWGWWFVPNQATITHWKPIILPEQEKIGKYEFMTQEERIAKYRKSVGDRWDEERECWVSEIP